MASAIESEQVATKRLADYLSEILDDRVEGLGLERVAGGWSRQTYRAKLRSPGRGEFSLALRGELAASLLEDNLDANTSCSRWSTALLCPCQSCTASRIPNRCLATVS